MLRRALLVASCLIVPGMTWAEAPPSVPGINVATATARSGDVTSQSRAEGPGTTAATANATGTAPGAAAPAGFPPGMPPHPQVLSPSAPLNAKEKASVVAAAAWRNHYDKPIRDEGGVLRWTFGASLPSIVCAPLQVCDLALQPGEVVQQINPGDKVRWKIAPAVTGDGDNRVTHLIFKPTDAGLISSALIFTDRRAYSIKLVSTQTQWTPLTAFNYSDDTQQDAWEKYRQAMAAPAGNRAPAAGFHPSVGGDDVLNFNYAVTGNAAWKPLRVYSQHGKTYVQFPAAIRYETAPALVGLANDGGVFSSPSEQMLRYRIVGNGDTFMVDGLLDHAALVSGVGSSQTRVDIRKGRS